MPTLFTEKKFQDILASPTPKTQVAAVVDWLLAGAPQVLAAYPKNPTAGSDLRLASELLDLGAVKKVELRDAKSGEVTTVDVTDAMRERSAEGRASIRVPVTGAAKGKAYVITVRDGKFTASADVTVAN
jgi:hypothetical protein